MFIKIFLKWNLITILILVLSILLFHLMNPSLPDLERNTCPACFGTSLCEDFDNNLFHVHSNNLTDKLKNFISTKLVVFANLHDERVVLKKLGHSHELEDLNNKICAKLKKNHGCDVSAIRIKDINSEIYELIRIKPDKPSQGILCPQMNATDFLYNIIDLSNENIKINVWTTLHVNPEPLVLQAFKRADGWPVPRYLGACGRFIGEEYCGEMLHAFVYENWFLRADLALQLVNGVVMFTNAHPKYRLYLTDISPDNIAVDHQNRIHFIDMENVIIQEKFEGENHVMTRHTSGDYEDCSTCFTFSVDDLCSHSISDHNYFAMCKFILSAEVPWPMITGGLLHSPPGMIKEEHSAIFQLVRDCVNIPKNNNRFEIINKLINALEKVIADKENY